MELDFEPGGRLTQRADGFGNALRPSARPNLTDGKPGDLEAGGCSLNEPAEGLGAARPAWLFSPCFSRSTTRPPACWMRQNAQLTNTLRRWPPQSSIDITVERCRTGIACLGAHISSSSFADCARNFFARRMDHCA